MKSFKLKDAVDQVAEVRAQLNQIISEIEKHESELKQIGKTTKPAEQLIAEFSAAGDALAAKCWSRPPRDARHLFVDPVSVVEGHTGQLDPTPLIEFLWVIAGDQIKERYAEKIRSRPAGIPDAERAQKTEAISKKINDLWADYENVASELDAAGFEINRDPRIPPQIYLHFDPQTRSYDKNRITKLEGAIAAQRGETAKFQTDCDNIDAGLVAAERELFALRNSQRTLRDGDKSRADDEAALLAKIQTLGNQRTELSATWDERGKYYTTQIAILQRCREFIERENLAVQPGVTKFMTMFRR